jgi:hypothetical protein
MNTTPAPDDQPLHHAPACEPGSERRADERGAQNPGERSGCTDGSSVTPVTPISGPREWHLLATGIDSFYFGAEVFWSPAVWPVVRKELESGRERAVNTQGVLLHPRLPLLIYPSGKRPNYRWHLQHPDFHLFLADQAKPLTEAGNAYFSIGSEALWRDGLRKAVYGATELISRLGGRVNTLKPSRCDFSADFRVPGGLAEAFLETHMVCPSTKNKSVRTATELETFHVGAASAAVQLRIYNKSREIEVSGKNWFREVWGEEAAGDVWRVEFQLRRCVLRQFDVNSLDDLQLKLAGIWAYLTQDWFSLRLRDNENTTRRSVVPFWSAVQGLADRFGPLLSVSRTWTRSAPSIEKTMPRLMGYFKSFAALKSSPDFDSAVCHLIEAVYDSVNPTEFATEVTERMIRIGLAPKDQGSLP